MPLIDDLCHDEYDLGWVWLRYVVTDSVLYIT